jgi:hypothetical protein
MSGSALVLAIATALVVAGALRIFVTDLHNDQRSRARAVAEAVLPLAGVAALVWWSWSAL